MNIKQQDDSPRNTCSCAHIGGCDGSCAPYIAQPESSRARFEAHIAERNPAASLNRHPNLHHLYALAWVNEAWLAWRKALAQQSDIGRDAALLSVIRDGVPLEEPVSVAKAMMAQEKARISLSGGTGPLATVFLVNIQVQPWTHTQGTATAYADGFNRGVEWLRSSIIEYADKLPTQAAPEVASVPDAGDEPVYWSVTYQGEHTANAFPTKGLAQATLDRLNAKHPGETREIVPLYTRPQPAPAVLSDEQIAELAANAVEAMGWDVDTKIIAQQTEFVRAVLAAAGVKCDPT